MSSFDPGPGWRQVPWSDVSDGDTYLVMRRYGEVHEEGRAWVREASVSPLPTETYTVIRVTWKQERASTPLVWTLQDSGFWHGPLGYYDNPKSLADRITGFEVLSEPRAVTAQAVLNRVRALTVPAELRVGMIPVLVQVADELGVNG